MKILANHAHLMPPNDQPGSWWPKGDAEMLLKHLDDCGIERVVVFPPFACQVENSMKEANLWAWKQVRRHPDRFIPAGTLFPLAKDILEMLDLLHAEGIRLAKIHPAIDPHDVADPKAEACYARAEELGIALDYHTGPHGSRLALADPVKYDNIAWDHPKLKLVFEHLGGRTYFELFMAVLCNHCESGCRVFAGLTSVLSAATHPMWYLGPERVMDLVKCVGADKLIYGLDFPWNSAESNKRDIEIIRGLDISEDDKAKILGGNLGALVGV